MKKMYLYGLLFSIGLFLCGCNQETIIEPNNQPIELEPKYYPKITWTEADEAKVSACYIYIYLDKNFTNKILTVEDFPGLEIEELEWCTEKKYKNYLEEGSIPDNFRQSYTITLKNKESKNYIEALEYLKEVNYDFIKGVHLVFTLKTPLFVEFK